MLKGAWLKLRCLLGFHTPWRRPLHLMVPKTECLHCGKTWERNPESDGLPGF